MKRKKRGYMGNLYGRGADGNKRGNIFYFRHTCLWTSEEGDGPKRREGEEGYLLNNNNLMNIYITLGGKYQGSRARESGTARGPGEKWDDEAQLILMQAKM